MYLKKNFLNTLFFTLTLITFMACNKNEFDVKTAEFSVTEDSVYLTKSTSFVAKDSLGGNEYSWDFGDGTTLNGKYNVTHKYEKGGTYLASMTINGIKSSKEVTVNKGTLSFRILNKSSKYIDFLTYIDNYETGSVSRFLVGSNSQSHIIYGSNLYMGDLHIFGISFFIENSEYTLPDIIWLKDFQHRDIIVTDSTKLIPRSSHGDSNIVFIKDL
ncbi:MAG: PKD domain-containing protein [Paludibacter sp.]|nr:PKD domain-containing protein [Paludibacter sp.]